MALSGSTAYHRSDSSLRELTLLPASVSAVLPICNEDGAIREVIECLVNTLATVLAEFEIIAVDDGSTDETATILRTLAAENGNVRVVGHAVNEGYGSAVRTGIAAARFAVTLIFDADGQFDASDVVPALMALNTSRCVLGIRAPRADNLYRRCLGRFGNWLAKPIVGFRVFDVNCGLKLFYTADLRPLKLRSTGGFLSTELLRTLGLRADSVRQMTVSHRPRRSGSATGGTLRTMLQICREAAREMPAIVQRCPASAPPVGSRVHP